MPEAIKLNFPKSNVLSDKYRSVLMIEEMKKIMKCGNLGHFPSCKFLPKLQFISKTFYEWFLDYY